MISSSAVLILGKYSGKQRKRYPFHFEMDNLSLYCCTGFSCPYRKINTTIGANSTRCINK